MNILQNHFSIDSSSNVAGISGKSSALLNSFATRILFKIPVVSNSFESFQIIMKYILSSYE